MAGNILVLCVLNYKSFIGCFSEPLKMFGNKGCIL